MADFALAASRRERLRASCVEYGVLGFAVHYTIQFTAHAFCADWTRADRVQAPTLDEARAFVADYEAARGATFAAAERRLLGAAFAYSVAYTARCGHAYGRRDRERPGTFHELLARHGRRLFEL